MTTIGPLKAIQVTDFDTYQKPYSNCY